jgi:hypothetical protein
VWVDDDTLLTELASALAPPAALALEPTVAEEEALRAAVAGRFPRLDWQPQRPRGRNRVWRALPLAAAGILVPASAAAAAGMPIPRPVRAVAHAVGLPVDSPALYDTYRHARQLRDAVEHQDQGRARETAGKLRKDLKDVPADDRKEAHQAGLPALAQAAPLLEAPAPPPPPAPAAPAESPIPPGDPASEPPTTRPRPKPAVSTDTTTDTAPSDTTTSTSTPSEDTTTSTTGDSTTTTTTDTTAPDNTSTTTTTGPDSDPSTTTSTTEPSTTSTTQDPQPGSR